ncbi:MAG: Ig-like domain-containing protein [Caldilineaceae bacterium]
MGTVKIESVDVQDDGRAVVSGTAAPGARVRVALSGRPLDTAIAGDDGRWEVQTAQPVSGLYTVSADVVDATGAVRALAVPVFAMLHGRACNKHTHARADSHRYAGTNRHGYGHTRTNRYADACADGHRDHGYTGTHCDARAD